MKYIRTLEGDFMNSNLFLSQNFGVLVLLIGFLIVLISDIHLERRMIGRFGMAVTFLLVYTVTYYIESELGFRTEYTLARAVLTAVNYSLVSWILCVLMLVIYSVHRKLLLLPAVIGTVLYFVSIPTKLVFYFTETNSFQRGPLGYLPYIITGLYLLILFLRLFLEKIHDKELLILLIFISATAVICFLTPLFLSAESAVWFVPTVAVDLLLYYVYLLRLFTMIDPLTNLLNRQCYYADAEKYADRITAVVAMDMDGLKEINDNEGHTAGDRALRSLADCFQRAAHRGERVYRIGGDEYLILATDADEAEIINLTERIAAGVARMPYSCSVGYAMQTGGQSIDELYKQADAMLYEAKRKFYEETGKTRRKQR